MTSTAERLKDARDAFREARKLINAFPASDVGLLSDALAALTDVVEALMQERGTSSCGDRPSW